VAGGLLSSAAVHGTRVRLSFGVRPPATVAGSGSRGVYPAQSSVARSVQVILRVCWLVRKLGQDEPERADRVGLVMDSAVAGGHCVSAGCLSRVDRGIGPGVGPG
jgi:hypothetical protein